MEAAGWATILEIKPRAINPERKNPMTFETEVRGRRKKGRKGGRHKGR